MKRFDAKSEISGRVIEVVAQIGQALAEDDPILIVESMKMEIPVCAPAAGVLAELRVGIDDTVAEGQVLAVMSAG